MVKTLFTIGYAGRTPVEVIALLKRHKITALCDVRSTPYSGRHPQFNRESFSEILNAHEIDYVFLGDELGARPGDPSCYINGKADHLKIIDTNLFKNGLKRVRRGMQNGYVPALMCSEKDPLTCHRAILICRSLRGQGIDMLHIIDHATIETQAELEKRLIAHLQLHPDMFKDSAPDALIERAYDAQADRIAYVDK